MGQGMVKKVLSALLVCFCLTMLPHEAMAAKNRHYDDRHKKIIINSIHINDRHFGYARQNRLSFRDLIVAKAIANESRSLDTEDVLKLMKRGYSHKRIAKKYNISWRKVDRRVDEAYRDMRRNAVKLGLTLWALDEILD